MRTRGAALLEVRACTVPRARARAPRGRPISPTYARFSSGGQKLRCATTPAIPLHVKKRLMPGTSSGGKRNEWLQYMKDCAAKYHEQKQPKPTKAAKPVKPANPPKNNKPAKITKEEQDVREWQARKEDVNRKQAHANMKRAKEHAHKAEQEHLARRRRAGA